jgi:FlaG/FlaF family flagellin (archaellin)
VNKAIASIILMVSLTVVIAGMIYWFVSEAKNEEKEVFTKEGKLLGFYPTNYYLDEIRLGINCSCDNKTFTINLKNLDKSYLQSFIGEDIVIIYEESGKDYKYKGAYLCPT